MTKATFNLERKTKPEVLFVLKCCGVGAYKIKNSTFESCNIREIPYTTIKVVPLLDTVRKKRIVITFCSS